MQRALLALSLAVPLMLLAACSEEELAIEEEGAGRDTFFKHGPATDSPPYPYLLTSYGGPNDSYSTGVPACGGKKVDGAWYYATGAWAFGCHSRLKLEANGKCVVVEVVDNGPAAWVEKKAAGKCGGTGYIIDASPIVSKHLFGSSSAGWSDCFAIMVTPVPASTPAGPMSCGAVVPPPPVPVPPPEPTPPGNPCGNGKLDYGELCDIGIAAGKYGACPWTCDDGDSCTTDQLIGSGCQAYCTHSGSCENPCGNGKVDSGELCDIGIAAGKPGACPTTCYDGNPCTTDQLIGSGCQAYCKYSGWCLDVPCGNGKLDAGEFCDIAIPAGMPGSCPTSCDDGNACTADGLTGTGCQVMCTHSNICPTAICGNGKVEPGEWCDTAIPAGYAGACPTNCNDNNPCTSDTLMGSGCLAICANPPIPSCGNTGGGVPTPPPTSGRAVGSPCTSNAECLSGRCLLEASGFAGGMCSRPCNGDCVQTPGESAAACVSLQGGYAALNLNGGGAGLCYAQCNYSLSPTGCRAGYRCVSRGIVGSGGQTNVCVPEAQAGNEAPVTAPPAAPKPGKAAGDGMAAGGCAMVSPRPAGLSLAFAFLLAALLVLRCCGRRRLSH